MVRNKKINNFAGLIILIVLLFATACSTPKRSGVALFVPERDFRNHPVNVSSQTQKVKLDTFSLSDNPKFSLPNTSPGDNPKTINDLDLTKIRITNASVDSGNANKHIDFAIEQNADNEKDTSIVEKQQAATDRFVTTSDEKQGDILQKTIVVSTYKEASPENRDSLSNIKSLIRSEELFHSDEASNKELVEKKIITDTVYIQIPTHTNKITDTLNRPINQKQPDFEHEQQNRISIAESKNYTTKILNSKPKDYLSQERNSENQYNYATSSQITSLQNEAANLLRQNQELKNAIDATKSSIEINSATNHEPTLNNEQLIADVETTLDRAVEATTLAQSIQTPSNDTVTYKIRQDTTQLQDTISKVLLTESSVMTEQLKDSISQLQAYIRLKNRTLDSLESKLVANSPLNDTILTTIYFAPGKTIGIDQKEKLQDLMVKINDKKVVKILLLSYTDSSGSSHLNLKLSNRRAVQLVDELTKLGIAQEKILLQYFGSKFASDEAIDNERRVEILAEISQ
ncbi:MAG: OmpA family protein [Paludibacteraceae bacterium]